MNMGERLRALRLERNISQEEVAKHIGITRSAYSHYEINNRQPVYETLIKLANFFNVSLDYMIGGTGHQERDEEAKSHESKILKLLQDMNQEQRQHSLHLLLEVARKDRSPSRTAQGGKRK